MPTIDVEGQSFEFPEGTPDTVIGEAIRVHFQTEQPTTQDVPRETLTPLGTETPEGRPIFKNQEGNFVTERTITENIPELGGFVNVPTVFDGKFLSPDEAIQKVIESNGADPITGRKLEIFPDVNVAVQSAESRSKSLGRMMGLPEDDGRINIEAEIQKSEEAAALKREPLISPAAEIAAGANKAITDLLDFLGPDQVNNILQIAGSESRVPTFGGAAEEIGATQGGFVEGKTGEVLRSAGEAIPLALGIGGALRTAATALPKVTPSVESFGSALVKQLAEKTTAAGDVVAAAGAGAGAELGKDGGVIGQVAGGIAGALTATGIKGALTKAPSVIKSLFSTAVKESGSEEAAAKLLAEQMVREGISPDDVAKRLTQLGDDAIPADAAASFSRILRTASNEIPRIEGRAKTLFRDRQLGQAKRLTEGFDEVGGTTGVIADDVIRALDDEFKPQINKLYDAARQKGVALGKMSRNILESPGLGRDARRAAEKTLQTRRTLGDKISNIDIIDATKQKLDDKIAVAIRSGERGLVRNLVRVKNALVKDADESIPEYKQARDMFAGKAQLESAADIGEQFFKLKPKEIENIVKSMGESERKMFRLGAKNAVLSKMDDTQTNANLVMRLFGRRGDIKKLRSVFDDEDSLSKFSDTLERESQFILTRRAAEANSTTIKQATDSESLRRAFESVVDATSSTTGAINAIKRITGGLKQKRTSEDFIEALSEAGDILLNKNIQPSRVAALLKKGNAEAIERELRKAIKQPLSSKKTIPTVIGISQNIDQEQQ